MKIWAAWKAVKNSNKRKPDKLPMSYQVNPTTGTIEVKPASCNDPNTWMSFEDAVKLLKSSKKYKGLQIALSPYPPEAGKDVLVAGDVDKAFRKDGAIDAEKLAAVMAIGSYAELSPTVPSHDYDDGGLRFLCFGHFPTDAGKHNGDYEIYQNSKWITITGHRILEAPATVNNAQEAIDSFRAAHFKPYYEIDTSDLPTTDVDFTDEEIISRLERSPNEKIREAFKHLFYEGPQSDDYSVNEWDMLVLVRGWTQKPEQLDSIYRKSKLCRPKWDEVHYANGDTYGERTIKNVLGSRTQDSWIYRSFLDLFKCPIPEKIDWADYELTVGCFTVNIGGICTIKWDKNDNKIETKISSTPCLITAKGVNRDNGEIHYKVLILDGVCHENVLWRRGSGLLKKTGVLELMEYGLEFKESDYALMNELFFNLINSYRHKLPMEVVASSSGWKDDYTEFVIGNKVVSSKGIFDIIQIDNSAAMMYGQTGTAEAWAVGVDDIMKFPQTRFKAYAAFGCLILRKADIENYIFDQHCGTTRLKSFTNRLVASMFGHPKKQQISAKSTALGIERIAAACNDLPVFLDETSENVTFVMELIYRFANSNTRVKSNQSSGLEMSKNFCSGLFLTGEDSIVTESSKGGHHARRVPETHGVPEDKNGKPVFVTEEVKNKVKKSMNENYGNIAILFVQELLPIINDIDSIYAENFKKLPDTGTDALAGRLKGYYAVILTAGQILEKVFKKLGMTECDPLSIVESYFVENVINCVSEPDFIKILRIAYDMYVSDKSHFGATAGSAFIECEKIDIVTKYGWIDIKDGVTTVNFRPQALKDYVIKALGNRDGVNRYETALTQWKLQGILNPTVTKSRKTGAVKIVNTKQIRTAHDDKQYAIQIPLEQFYKHLGFEKESEQPNYSSPEGESNDSVSEASENFRNSAYDIPKISANIPASTGGALNQVSIVSANLPENIIVPDSSVNLYDVIMNEMGGEQ